MFDQDPRVLRDHLAHMRRLFDSDALLLGGPAYDGRSGIALLETPSLDGAAALIGDDPAVRTGLFTYTIRRLTPYFDAFDGTRSPR
ncbi:YciI family protein [Nocardioides sp. GCM10028917]|uniref:YciI family protein n=1 Tax=Nocardioides sp. GCM10028917 TaxID=3273408 RepID=UPI003615C9A6